jgi:hypothetical protein
MIEEIISFYEPETLFQVIFVTVVLGGGCAWMTGRAIATTWRPLWHIGASMVLFTAAVRFLHFALFEGHLLAPLAYVFDLVFLTAVALLAYRYTRAQQMTRQYYWLYEAHGPFGWKRRADAPESSI